MTMPEEVDLSLLEGIVRGLINEGRVRGCMIGLIAPDGSTYSFIDSSGPATFIERLGLAEQLKLTLCDLWEDDDGRS